MAINNTSATEAALKTLRAELEAVHELKFEALAADLLSRLLDDIGVFIAKTGSQFGGDAGTAGLQRRRVRLECKRYKQSTSLSPRELAGEVVQASVADPDLEAWLLAATKKVSETERNLARDEAEKRGFPMIVIDWTEPAPGAGIAPLAAICAQWPEVVEKHVGKVGADAARTLTPHIGTAVKNLRRDLEEWNIGFEKLRTKSAAYLQRVWTDSAQAKAVLNQDAAGGKASVQLLERKGLLQELSDWWLLPGNPLAPVAVTGMEGVGKTWTALDWTVRNLQMLPIVLTFPASTFLSSQDLSDAGVRDLIASSLRRICGSHHGLEYWRLRVDRLLKRPVGEGFAFLLLIDGLNQQPYVPWVPLAQALQGDALAGRVRMLFTSRKHYFEEDLRQFKELVARPVHVKVGAYSADELKTLLGLHGMSSADLSPALLNLAATPRLFPLVVRLKDQDAMRSDATVLRLLFEYGKDVHQVRQQAALTESDWVQWLAERAHEYRKHLLETGANQFTTTVPDVAKSLNVHSVSKEDVARRLSDVIDGSLFRKESTVTGTQKLVLRQDPTVLGLGIALLDTLSGATDSFETAQTRAIDWLEPVAAIDLSSEVLKAALAILSATGTPDAAFITDALLVLWMNVQNPSVDIERDAFAFGEAFPRSMLTVVEQSSLSSQSSALHYAVQSLRRLPCTRVEDWNIIRSRMLVWASQVTLPDRGKLEDPNHYAKRHNDNLIERIGTANPGVVFVQGEALELAHVHPGDPSLAIPSILEGHDLTMFMPVIRRAAVRQAVGVDLKDRCWEGLRWVLLMGCQSPDSARDEVALIAEDILTRDPEKGVHPRLRNRIAAYLLRLTGMKKYEARAREVNETFASTWDYKADYLDNPGESFFELEHRHIDAVLKDNALDSGRKLERLFRFLAHPDLKLPPALTDFIVKALKDQQFTSIDEAGQRTVEEHRLQRLMPSGARVAPTELAHMARRWLRALADRRDEQKYWAALASPELLLVADEENCEKFFKFRTDSVAPNHDQMANSWSLQLELLHKPLEAQLQLLLNADDWHPFTDLVAEVRPAKSSQLHTFLKSSNESARAANVVMQVMAHQQPVEADELARDLLKYLDSGDKDLRAIAFVALSLSAPEVTGQALMASNWRAEATDLIAAHYGSRALAAATKHLPLEELLPLVAPWRWLDATMIRGANADELKLASGKLLDVLGGSSAVLPNVEGLLSVRVPGSADMAQVLVSEPDTPNVDLRTALRQSTRSPEEVNKRMAQLAKDAAAAIDKVRASGHSFYLHSFDSEAVDAAYRSDPAIWDRLLDGVDVPSKEFKHRVHRAEGLYLRLCEVMLTHAPVNGLRLWRALLDSMTTRFNGPAKIAELMHLVFRAPESPEVLAARADLVGLRHCNTDQDILELVIVAQMHGCDTWLDKQIADDEASEQLWKRRRAIVLKGFSSLPPIDQLNWPEGQPADSTEELQRRQLAWTNRGALAKYWWEKFVTAPDADQAFAAWHIFLENADRRAWVWRRARPEAQSELDRVREIHLRSNKDLYKRALNKPEEGTAKLGERFLGMDKPRAWLMLDGALAR